MKQKGHVEKLSKKIIQALKPFCKKIQIAGSIRRKEPNPIDIDLILIPKNKEKILDYLNKKGKFMQGGEKRATFKIEKIKVELYFTKQESWGATLLAYSSKTGSAIGLRMVAKRKGFHLNQYGLFKKGKFIAGKTEREIYKALGRPYKVPEKR